MDIELIQKIITGSANASDKRKHRELLGNSAYLEEYETLRKIWNASGHTFNSFNKNTGASWEKVLAKRTDSKDKRGNRTISIAPGLKWAAIIIILLGLGGVLTISLYKTGSRKVQQVYMALDTIKEIRLPDQTKVFLNKDAILKVAESFNGETREVILEGEAFFEVAKNPVKPFKIYCSHTSVKVLGTSFNVYENNREEIVEVNVASGKVLLEARSLLTRESVILNAGESGQYNLKNRRIEKSVKTSANYLSWKTGRIKFNSTPLDEVCETLGHDFDKEIIPVGENIDEILLTVSFKNKGLDEILEVISLTLDAEVSQEEGRIYITLN